MFLAKDPNNGYYVFTIEDPRNDGFGGHVEEDVSYDTDGDLLLWPDGSDAPNPILGVAMNDPKSYGGFRTRDKCREAGFRPIDSALRVVNDFGTWREYKEAQETKKR